MARRSSLPGADELFRTTSTTRADAAPAPQAPAPDRPAPAAQEPLSSAPAEPSLPAAARTTTTSTLPSLRALPDHEDATASPPRKPRSGSGVRRVSKARSVEAEHRPSGRERHEEKITVYVSPQELLELERARWVLRAEHGLASDRGRIVREAVAVVLADLEAKGPHSILVTRLQEPESR